MSTNKSKLKYILEDLFAKARATPNVNAKSTLRNGLHLVMVATSQEIELIIYRTDSPPSDNELKTILQHFPYYVESARVKTFLYNGHSAIHAAIQLPRQEQHKYF